MHCNAGDYQASPNLLKSCLREAARQGQGKEPLEREKRRMASSDIPQYDRNSRSLDGLPQEYAGIST